MNKKALLISATVFGIAGGYLPSLWGDTDFFSPGSILFGMIGGIFGIFVGVVISKRFL